MNTEKQSTQAVRKNAGEPMLSPNRTPRAVRKTPNKKLMQTLRAMMLMMGGMILVLGALLVVLPMFRVQSVEIEGYDFYQYEEILAASGIRVGEDESMSLDGNAVAKSILKACPYVKSCTVMTLPFSVKITVVEKEDIKYTAIGGYYASFDREFQALEIIENGEERFSPFLHVKLPAIKELQAGRAILFSDEAGDRSYINQLCDALKAGGVMENVTYIDFSERFSVSMVLQDRFWIELGKVSDMELKLSLIEETLKKKEEAGTDLKSEYAVLDVSNPKEKTIYNSVESLDGLY